MYIQYQIFLSLLKIDLQFNLSLVALGGFSLYASVDDPTLWLSVGMCTVTVLFNILASETVCYNLCLCCLLCACLTRVLLWMTEH